MDTTGSGLLGDRLAAPDRSALPDSFIRGRVMGQESVCAAGRGRNIGLWEPFPMSFDDGGMFRFAGEIRPFVRIIPHVVKFLNAIRVTDVAPAFAADAVEILRWRTSI